MKLYPILLLFVATTLAAPSFGELVGSTPRQQPDDDRLRISADSYRDKVYASWLGQLVGNFYGLPHENVLGRLGRLFSPVVC